MSALTKILLVCANAPDNFPERESVMHIGVKWGGGYNFQPILNIPFLGRRYSRDEQHTKKSAL